MCQSQEDVPGFPETLTNDACHCSPVNPLLLTQYSTAVPVVSLVPPAQFSHMRVQATGTLGTPQNVVSLPGREARMAETQHGRWHQSPRDDFEGMDYAQKPSAMEDEAVH